MAIVFKTYFKHNPLTPILHIEYAMVFFFFNVKEEIS